MTWFMMGTLTVAAALMVGRCGAAPVGLVDTQRVLNESVKALQYQKQLNDREKQIQTQIQSETTKMRTLQGQMQAAQRQRAAVFSLIVADLRIEAAGLAQEKGWDVVLTQAVSAPGATDVTDQLIARIKH